MRNRSLLFVLLITLFIFTTVEKTSAQTAPVKQWDKVFGGDDYDALTIIVPTADGNYLLGGSSLSEVSGSKSQPSRNDDPPNYYPDFWVVKMDADGNRIWDKTFGGGGLEELHAIVPSADGGFLLVGSSWSGISGDKTENSKGGYDFWIVKIDANGIKQWDKTIGGSADEMAYAAVATSDGGFLIGGSSDSDISGDKSGSNRGYSDFWLVKINAVGTKLWDKTFGGLYDDMIQSLTLTNDGGFLLGGRSNSPISSDKTGADNGAYDYWVVKTDQAGTLQWDKSFGGINDENLIAGFTTSDGGYLLAGVSDSGPSGNKTAASKGGSDFWIVKMDGSGNKIWDKALGGSEDDIMHAALTTSGGFLFGGSSRSGISGDHSQPNIAYEDYWVIKTDASGSKLWDKNIGASSEDYLTALSGTADDGFLLGGWSYSGVSGDKTAAKQYDADYWIVKLAAPNTITTGTIALSSICTGTQLTVDYTATGIYTGNNSFTAQLSDAAGSFAAPVNIGSISSTALSGSINATVPTGTAAGNGYRIRVVASNLATTGSDNGTDLILIAPPALAIRDTLVCQGGNLSFNAPVLPGAIYAWTGPDGFSAATSGISINHVTNVHGGTYMITITANGCTSNQSANVVIGALPSANVGNPKTICLGSNTTLGAVAVTGNSYNWSSNPAGFSSLSANPSVSPTVTTTYNLIETTAAGCSKTDSVIITVNAAPVDPAVTISGATTICQGETVSLNASYANGNQWYKDGTAIIGATASSYAASASGVYTVKTTIGACTTGASAGVTITVNQLPATPTITAAGNVLNSSSANGNQWYLNGTSIAGANGQTYTAQASGEYIVQVTQNNCKVSSSSFNFIITALVNTSVWNGEVKAYPNPVSKTVFIKNQNGRRLQLQLVDIAGRKLYEVQFSGQTGSIDMGTLPRGIYQLLITDIKKKETVTMRIIKQ